MTTITMKLVSELRQRTGAAIVACKNALVKANGDLDAAIRLLQERGQIIAERKQGCTAAEGLIATHEDETSVAMVEVNCQTDFVARSDLFRTFVRELLQRILHNKINDTVALLSTIYSAEQTVADYCKVLVVQLGENIQIRRLIRVEKTNTILGHYVYMDKIGVIVQISAGDLALAKDLALQIVANNPLSITREDVPEEVIAREREIFSAQVETSGKPQEIVERIVTGRIDKFLNQITLLGQPFIKDSSITVSQLLQKNNARVISFTRFMRGEGIEKQHENFSDVVRKELEKY